MLAWCGRGLLRSSSDRSRSRDFRAPKPVTAVAQSCNVELRRCIAYRGDRRDNSTRPLPWPIQPTLFHSLTIGLMPIASPSVAGTFPPSARTKEAIASLALLKVQWDRHGTSYIDNFLPFVRHAIGQSTDALITTDAVQTAIERDFGLRLPQQALRALSNSCCSQGVGAGSTTAPLFGLKAMAMIQSSIAKDSKSPTIITR